MQVDKNFDLEIYSHFDGNYCGIYNDEINGEHNFIVEEKRIKFLQQKKGRDFSNSFKKIRYEDYKFKVKNSVLYCEKNIFSLDNNFKNIFEKILTNKLRDVRKIVLKNIMCKEISINNYFLGKKDEICVRNMDHDFLEGTILEKINSEPSKYNKVIEYPDGFRVENIFKDSEDYPKNFVVSRELKIFNQLNKDYRYYFGDSSVLEIILINSKIDNIKI